MTSQIAKEFTFSGLLKFAFPTMVMMIVLSLYTLIDSLFISNFIGTDALAAVNIVWPAISIIMALGIMMATGGSALIARKLGLGERENACNAFTIIVISTTLGGIVLGLLGIIFIDSIINGLGSTPLIFSYCKDYLGIYLLFAPITILQLLFQIFFVTAGKPSWGLYLVIIAGCTNALLDYIFIVKLGMGVSGAALATGIGQTIPAVAGLVFFFKTKGNLRFIRPYKMPGVLIKSCSNGASEMVTNLSIAVTSFLFNITMMKYLGVDGVAAITVIVYVQFMLNSLYMGFSMGVAPIISYNHGSENTDLLKRIFKMCMKIIGVSSLLTFTIAIVFSSNMLSLFTQPGTPVYEIAASGFILFSINFIFSGYNIFTSAMYTAFSNGKISAFLSLMRTFVFITACLLLLPQVIDVDGIFLAIPLAEMLTFILSLIFLIKGKKAYQYF